MHAGRSSGIIELRELFGKGEHGPDTGTDFLQMEARTPLAANTEKNGGILGKQRTPPSFICRKGSRGDSCGLFAFYGFGRGRENRNSVEEGIQIRLDEMRILFFRIRREEERAEEKRTGRTGAE